MLNVLALALHHPQNDTTTLMTLIDVGMGLDRAVQRITAVNDRFQYPGRGQTRQELQVFQLHASDTRY